MARICVYSTLTSPQDYVTWSKPVEAGSLPHIMHRVHIEGGANIANKQMVTPRGVCTEVSEDDYEHLKINEIFLKHVQNGFIVVRHDKVDPEVAVAAGMKQKDQSAPHTPESEEFSGTGAKPMEGKPERTGGNILSGLSAA